MKHSATHILKFGGTSLQNPSFIKQAADIVQNRTQSARPVIVVSALAGVTDRLLELSALRPDDIQQSGKIIDELQQKHLEVFSQLVPEEDHRREHLTNLFQELRNTVTISLDDNQQAQKDRILSIGERASAIIFAATLSATGHPAEAFEANNFIKTDAAFGQANVHSKPTHNLIRKFLKDTTTIPVVTGFIGSDDQQRITTLGRSGSDYTAGLLANALEADYLEIWTDVNGVLSADPKWVPTAEPIDQLSFADIGELSAHGARVIHPKTIRPINNKNTSVLVKNSYNPSHPGTQISNGFKSNGSFKTITISGPFTRLRVEGRYAYDLIDQLRRWLPDKNDTETWSSDTESSLGWANFLIREPAFEKVQQNLFEWADTHEVQLHINEDLFKVKKFSNHFNESEELTAQLWNLLSARNLRPIEVKRNRNERFISLLFDRDEARRAARLINDYAKPETTTVDLFIAGTGAVGNTLLQQLKDIEPDNIRYRLLGSCNSRKALWQDEGINLQSELDWSDAEQTDWNALINKLTESHRHNLIFVDATGSKEVARLYPELFASGIHVVTPSKLANTFEQSFFDTLQDEAKNNNVQFRYETTVGAGLPVISTLENLRRSGDEITEISGVVSGTMTYLFNQLEKGTPFSEAIIDAREKGYAEPDPRDDLSGEDVARKFLTLARTLGYKVERDELKVESLIPEELEQSDRETFLSELKKYDNGWQKRITDAQQKNYTLRYTGNLKDGSISIGIETVSQDSPLGQLEGTDNLIQIYSRYYNQTPLVIQGPGAGKEVTAASVLADISAISETLT